jgi:hypothetical protein
MVDTAQNGTEPVLDLDAMLEDLHNEFQGDPIVSEGDGDPGDGGVPPVEDQEPAVPTADEPTPPSPDAELDSVLPPGMVQFGEEVLPQNEVQALLELNRRVKSDNDLASRVRQAVLGQQESTNAPAQDADALPAWLDPDDLPAVNQFRHTQRLERELEEVRRKDQLREAQFLQTAEQQRQAEVIDAFRSSMKEFRDEYPAFTLEDLNVITQHAAGMGLLEAPEKIGKTLRGGIVKALELAMWDSPEFRAKVTAGDTVRTKAEQSQARKQKSSALSSSTGSTPRTQSQEPAPTNRTEVMAAGLEFLRSQASLD